MTTDAFTEGARDCRANNLNRAFAFEGDERASYEHGWRRALALACQRIDVAAILPQHFSSGGRA